MQWHEFSMNQWTEFLPDRYLFGIRRISARNCSELPYNRGKMRKDIDQYVLFDATFNPTISNMLMRFHVLICLVALVIIYWCVCATFFHLIAETLSFLKIIFVLFFFTSLSCDCVPSVNWSPTVNDSYFCVACNTSTFRHWHHWYFMISLMWIRDSWCINDPDGGAAGSVLLGSECMRSAWKGPG